MHLAILVTNTDDSDFAQNHPKDGEKFPTMMTRVRPDWSFAVFEVKDGQFPETLDGFDGVMISGSPASVHDDAPWIGRLFTLIDDIVARKLPLFGACFGHQAIAMALGGRVEKNPGGYMHGLIQNRLIQRKPWMHTLPEDLKLYGSHVEQVTILPEGANPVTSSEGCPIAGFAMGSHVYTSQHHPEMTPGFIAALTEELSEYLGPQVTGRARASLAQTADSDAFAESIARFFEMAQPAS